MTSVAPPGRVTVASCSFLFAYMASSSRGALMAGGHHFGAVDRQPPAVEDDNAPPPMTLEDQVRYGLKRTYTMFLANYGQRPEVDTARCARSRHG